MILFDRPKARERAEAHQRDAAEHLAALTPTGTPRWARRRRRPRLYMALRPDVIMTAPLEVVT